MMLIKNNNNQIKLIIKYQLLMKKLNKLKKDYPNCNKYKNKWICISILNQISIKAILSMQI